MRCRWPRSCVAAPGCENCGDAHHQGRQKAVPAVLEWVAVQPEHGRRPAGPPRYSPAARVLRPDRAAVGQWTTPGQWAAAPRAGSGRRWVDCGRCREARVSGRRQGRRDPERANHRDPGRRGDRRDSERRGDLRDLGRRVERRGSIRHPSTGDRRWVHRIAAHPAAEPGASSASPVVQCRGDRHCLFGRRYHRCPLGPAAPARAPQTMAGFRRPRAPMRVVPDASDGTTVVPSDRVAVVRPGLRRRRFRWTVRTAADRVAGRRPALEVSFCRCRHRGRSEASGSSANRGQRT